MENKKIYITDCINKFLSNLDFRGNLFQVYETTGGCTLLNKIHLKFMVIRVKLQKRNSLQLLLIIFNQQWSLYQTPLLLVTSTVKRLCRRNSLNNWKQLKTTTEILKKHLRINWTIICLIIHIVCVNVINSYVTTFGTQLLDTIRIKKQTPLLIPVNNTSRK